MQKIYIQNKDGEPLMPTSRYGAVRRWLRGYFEICDIHNNKFEKSFKYTQLQKLCSTNIMEVQAAPPTAKSVGIIA